jgi:hypothetical protein
MQTLRLNEDPEGLANVINPPPDPVGTSTAFLMLGKRDACDLWMCVREK